MNHSSKDFRFISDYDSPYYPILSNIYFFFPFAKEQRATGATRSSQYKRLQKVHQSSYLTVQSLKGRLNFYLFKICHQKPNL